MTRSTLVLLAALAGCAGSAPVRVQPDATRADVTIVDLSSCGWALAAVTDRRTASTAGNAHGRAIDRTDLTPRLISALHASGLRLPAPDRPGEVALAIEILHAYGQSKANSVTFTTVLRAVIEGRSLTARGVSTMFNWMSATGEVSRGLLASVDAATSNLLQTLQAECEPGSMP